MNIEDIRLSELIKPTPKQRQCIESTDGYRFTLYGGAAGGGKSYLLRWWCLRQLLKRYSETGITGLTVGLFSADYPTLQDRQISKIAHEFPEWLGQVKRTEKEGFNFFVKEEYGGGRIALRNLADPSSYKSAEFCDIAVEELSENKRDVFEDLVLFRLRSPGVDRPAFLAATNPTGVGLQWIKALWVDRKFPKELEHLKQEFNYVPALLQDNPHLGADYAEALKGLPDRKRRALLEGDWSIPEGQYFTNFERSERSVHPSVLSQLVREWWPRWISQDWGFKHHSPVHWHTVGDVMPEQAHLLGRKWDTPRKCVFTYREHVVSLSETGQSEEEWAKRIVQMTGSEKLKRYFLSSDAFGQKSSANTPAQVISKVFRQGSLPSPEPANMAPGSRVTGWRFLYQMIQSDSWFISELCPLALDAIPALEYDTRPGHDEDILKTDNIYDDIGDCFVGNTLIETFSGPVPIGEVREGDLVQTRQGLKPVLHAWIKRKNADIVKAVFSDGRSVCCTKDHLFFSGDSFFSLDDLRYGDKVEVWNPSTIKAENTLSCLLGTIEQTSVFSTGRYGQQQTVPFHLSTTSTIETAIVPTTLSRTWNAYWGQNILPVIKEVAKLILRTWLGLWNSLKNGIDRMRVEHGILNTLQADPCLGWVRHASAVSLDLRAYRNQDFAARSAKPNGDGTVSRTMSRSLVKHAEPNSALIGMNRSGFAADPVRLVSVMPAGKADVYDLEVEGAHEFYANGILVHNCLRYGLQDMLNSGKQPFSEILQEKVSQVARESGLTAANIVRLRMEHERRGKERWTGR